MSANLARVPIFMCDLADIAARTLIDELGMDPTRAAAVGFQIARNLCTEYGGEHIFVPSGFNLDRAEQIARRDRKMYAFYCQHGRDANATAREFKLSAKQVYERVRVVEAARQAENQDALFNANDEDSE